MTIEPISSNPSEEKPIVAEVLEVGEVDQDIRRGRPRLHHVHERLAASERSRALVPGQQRDRLVDGRRARVFDLSQEHLPGLRHTGV